MMYMVAAVVEDEEMVIVWCEPDAASTGWRVRCGCSLETPARKPLPASPRCADNVYEKEE